MKELFLILIFSKNIKLCQLIKIITSMIDFTKIFLKPIFIMLISNKVLSFQDYFQLMN